MPKPEQADSPLQRIPGKGIRVSLNHFALTRLGVGANALLEIHAQELIRGAGEPPLAKFLAIAEIDPEDPSGVMFSAYSAEGKELLSRSVSATSARIPRKEWQAFRTAVEALESLLEDRRTEDDNRKAIAAFRIPDPETYPGFFRVSGPIWKRRFHLIWGCEHKLKTGVIPGSTQAELYIPPPQNIGQIEEAVERKKMINPGPSWPVLFGLLTFGLIGLWLLLCVFGVINCDWLSRIIQSTGVDSQIVEDVDRPGGPAGGTDAPSGPGSSGSGTPSAPGGPASGPDIPSGPGSGGSGTPSAPGGPASGPDIPSGPGSGGSGTPSAPDRKSVV